jgi:hypothetical protein
MFQVGLARANSVREQDDHNFVIQDLMFGVGCAADEGDIVDIRYIVFPLTAGKLGQVCLSVMKNVTIKTLRRTFNHI